jgi:hypothetical protein
MPTTGTTIMPRLGWPGLGGIYDDTPTDAVLAGLELSSEQLLTAVKSPSRVRGRRTAGAASVP